jgi:hypothetical protein
MHPVSFATGVGESPEPGGAGAPAVDDNLPAAWQMARTTGLWLFDAARHLHAIAVQASWLRNSLLDARDFEHLLDAHERATLGPLARRV